MREGGGGLGGGGSEVIIWSRKIEHTTLATHKGLWTCSSSRRRRLVRAIQHSPVAGSDCRRTRFHAQSARGFNPAPLNLSGAPCTPRGSPYLQQHSSARAATRTSGCSRAGWPRAPPRLLTLSAARAHQPGTAALHKKPPICGLHACTLMGWCWARGGQPSVRCSNHHNPVPRVLLSPILHAGAHTHTGAPPGVQEGGTLSGSWALVLLEVRQAVCVPCTPCVGELTAACKPP